MYTRLKITLKVIQSNCISAYDITRQNETFPITSEDNCGIEKDTCLHILFKIHFYLNYIRKRIEFKCLTYTGESVSRLLYHSLGSCSEIT